MEPSKIETVPVSEENVNEVQHPDTEATPVSTTQTAQHSDTNSLPILVAPTETTPAESQTELEAPAPPFDFGSKSKYSRPDDAMFEEVRKGDLYMANKIHVKGKGKFEVGEIVRIESEKDHREVALVGVACHEHVKKSTFGSLFTPKPLRLSAARRFRSSPTNPLYAGPSCLGLCETT